MCAYPEISVVMSVYNGERHLRESVDSILNQTFQDFEFIIINDGSTDLSKDILESYKDKRIILMNQINMGLTISLNIALSMAKGKYIARQDADDISEPDRLEKQIDFMENNTAVGLLGSRFQIISEVGEIIGNCCPPLEDEIIKKGLIEMNQLCHGSVMIRREVLSVVGVYREVFKYAQDFDLWLRISEKYKVNNLPEYLIRYRMLNNSISGRKMLLQSRYAGLAIKQALLRRKTGTDEIQEGRKPKLPNIKQLSKSLKSNVVRFYKNHRDEMLRKKNIAMYLKDSFILYRVKLLELGE